MTRSLYSVLGVLPTSSQDEIKKAHRREALRWHPDRNKSPEAAAKFGEVTAAYEVLGDPKKRAEYDAGRSAAPPLASVSDVLSRAASLVKEEALRTGLDSAGVIVDGAQTLVKDAAGAVRSKGGWLRNAMGDLIEGAGRTVASGAREAIRGRREDTNHRKAP